MAEVVTEEQLREYLGVGEENLGLVAQLRAAAIEGLNRACGFDWTLREDVEQFNDAVRVYVWMSFYGVRDPSQNTIFLESHLTWLINSLKLCANEGTDSDGV